MIVGRHPQPPGPKAARRARVNCLETESYDPIRSPDDGRYGRDGSVIIIIYLRTMLMHLVRQVGLSS